MTNRSIPLRALHLLIMSIASCNAAIAFEPYLGQTPPGNTREMFAPGIVSTSLTAHSALYFTSDGREAYWSVLEGTPELAVIWECHVEEDVWSSPARVAFSGVYQDNGPFPNAADNRLYFMSIRPEIPDGIDVRSFWYADRQEAGWSEPTLLGEPFSSASIGWQGSMTAGGDIYFAQSLPYPQNRDVFRSRFKSGNYQPIERLSPEVNSSSPELAPYISPNGSYLIFSSSREGGFGSFDLWVCFANSDGTWSAAQNLGPTVNTSGVENFPSVSPDGEYLFFVSDGPGNFDYYWISASVVENLRPASAVPSGLNLRHRLRNHPSIR